MRLFPVSKTTSVVSIGTIVLVCIGGVLLYHETISIRQCIGLILGSASVFLIIT
jgi:drug/metabolite transporter (DMT)-like permease